MLAADRLKNNDDKRFQLEGVPGSGGTWLGKQWRLKVSQLKRAIILHVSFLHAFEARPLC